MDKTGEREKGREGETVELRGSMLKVEKPWRKVAAKCLLIKDKFTAK